MLRIASAWRSLRPNSAIIIGLGSSSSRMIWITRSRLRIGDQIAFEQLEPILDLGDPVLRAADQHFELMREPGRQHLLQPHHPRRVDGVEHVHVERDPHLEIGEPEQALHQHLRIDRAAARLDHDP